MRHLIVGHHWDDAYNRSLLDRYANALREGGHEVEVHIPTAEGLPLVLDRAEYVGTLEGRFAPDVEREQARVAAADAITFVFPLWWVGFPATMKGWIDRVLALNFAYGFTSEGAPRGLLAGKRGATLVTTGSPAAKYGPDGTFAALERVWNAHIFGVCGVEVVDNVWIDNALFADDAERALHRERVDALARRFLDG